MGRGTERELVGQGRLPLGGRVIIEADEAGVLVAWRTSGGGRGEAHFGRLRDDQVELILAVFRSEGAELAVQAPSRVRERLATALDPEGSINCLLGLVG